jgi:hypothetical protein
MPNGSPPNAPVAAAYSARCGSPLMPTTPMPPRSLPSLAREPLAVTR